MQNSVGFSLRMVKITVKGMRVFLTAAVYVIDIAALLLLENAFV